MGWALKDKIVELHCDSSAHTVAGALSQGEGNEEVVIAYGSKRLNESKMKYSTWQREQLAI